MFASLGLFNDARCPAPSCHRPRCFFSHGESSKPAAIKVLRKDPPTELAGTKRRASDQTDVKKEPRPALQTAVPAKKLKADESASLVGKTTTPPEVASVSVPKPRLPPTPVPAASINTPRRPIVQLTKSSNQTFQDRQKGVQTLYTQFAKLYGKILESHPDLAHRSAVAQETEVSTSSPNIKAYKTAIHHTAVSISKRPPPNGVDHPSIGTVKESRAKANEAEKARSGRLTRKRVEQYCMTTEELSKWSFPDPTDDTLLQGGGRQATAEGTSQICSRCKVPFIVSSAELDKRFGECRFHHGRPAPERIEGKRKWIYSCCRKERGEAGCEEGVHVFTDKDDDRALGSRVGWKTVQAVVTESKVGSDGWVDIVAMDCEMIYTTAGSSLARVTIVDEAGQVVLDELVRQTMPVLDLNTRFSGIHPGDLSKAIMDLPAVRATACAFIGPETIMVGHGLDNDLRAMRLLHDRVIDTAIVFPHDKGAPFRRALRDIVKEKLGYFIQDRTADLGHSSAVDAQSTLEILKWKVRDDAT